MSVTDLTADEMVESLTGFDEIAVEKHFGADVSALRTRPFSFIRALVFVHQRREGLTDPDARTAALSLTIGDLNGYFAEGPEEIDPEEPDTEPGKEG